jgi:hypothetical protein
MKSCQLWIFIDCFKNLLILLKLFMDCLRCHELNWGFFIRGFWCFLFFCRGWKCMEASAGDNCFYFCWKKLWTSTKSEEDLVKYFIDVFVRGLSRKSFKNWQFQTAVNFKWKFDFMTKRESRKLWWSSSDGQRSKIIL